MGQAREAASLGQEMSEQSRRGTPGVWPSARYAADEFVYDAGSIRERGKNENSFDVGSGSGGDVVVWPRARSSANSAAGDDSGRRRDEHRALTIAVDRCRAGDGRHAAGPSRSQRRSRRAASRRSRTQRA